MHALHIHTPRRLSHPHPRLDASSPEVRYNNLTLVSRQGLPGEVDCPLADLFLPHRGRYTQREHRRLQLGVWVNVVQAELSRIHR